MSKSLDYRPRSVAELVDAAVQLYRRDALSYILIAAIAYTPVTIVQIVAFGSGSEIAVNMTMFLGLLLGLMGYALMSAVLAHLSSNVYLGEPADVVASLRAVGKQAPAVIANMVLKWVGIMLGFILLIVPGIYLLTRWFATTPAIVLEQRGALSAFGRSSVLSRKRKRHIFNTLALVIILFYVGILAVAFLGAMLGLTENRIATQVLSTIFSVIAYPLIGITEMLLYYDARIRDEAFDVELLARALPATSSEAPLPQH